MDYIRYGGKPLIYIPIVLRAYVAEITNLVFSIITIDVFIYLFHINTSMLWIVSQVAV